ncbi:hypothetical protein WR25_24035 isoform B [Diploscapter pachys]|uniref:Uncharacterized protein n=1 Tax=Diploscapter pachys TaxID=2018661 RepID=A0A2A2JV02_9BILA|nr:hypothetical protein WR25_24035 isoform B [Diploscapter pachys]
MLEASSGASNGPGTSQASVSTKKRMLFEKIARCKEKKLLRCFSHQVEQVPDKRLAHLVKKASIASKPVKRLIEEDGRERKGIATVIGTGQPKRRRKDRTRADEAEYDTDYDDLDRNSTTSVDHSYVRWVNFKMPFESFDISMQRVIEQRKQHCRLLQKQINEMSLRPEERKEQEEVEGGSSARTTALDLSAHRRNKCTIYDNERESVDYSSMQPCTSSSCLTASRAYFQDTHPNSILMPDMRNVPERMETHMHRLALIPKLLLRKRNDAPFRVAEDIEEERSRNGIKRILEREKRRRKEQKEKGHANAHGHGKEGGQTGRQGNNHHNNHHKHNYALLHAADDSSGWEDTDDDDFYVPAKKSNNKKKTNNRRPNRDNHRGEKGGKLDRRGSAANAARVSNRWELEEIMPDITTAQLPQKFDYKEILVPSWTRLTDEDMSAIFDCNPVPESWQFCQTDRTLEQIIKDYHAQLEEEERTRFQVTYFSL